MSRNTSYSRHQSKSKRLPSTMQFVSDSRVGSLSDIQIGDKKLNVEPRVSKSSSSVAPPYYPSTSLQSTFVESSHNNNGLISALRQPMQMGQKSRGVQIMEPGQQRSSIDFSGTGMDEQSYAEALAQFGSIPFNQPTMTASPIPIPSLATGQTYSPPQFPTSHFPNFFPQQQQLQLQQLLPPHPPIAPLTVPMPNFQQQPAVPTVPAPSFQPIQPQVAAAAASAVGNNNITVSSAVFDDGTRIIINGYEIDIPNGKDGEKGEPGAPGKVTLADEKTMETMIEVMIQKSLQPTIESISKFSAPIGTNLTIYGRRFMRGAIILWGDQTVSDVCVFENRISFVVPKFRVQKSIDVQVSNPDFRLSNSVKFNYE